MPDQLARKNLCPLLDRPCVGVDCKWYLQLEGTDPQDASKQLSGWDCAIVWQVQATLDVRKATTGGLDGVQKATESFRNESLKATVGMMRAMAPRSNMKLIESGYDD
jgi:hypothetical protein